MGGQGRKEIREGKESKKSMGKANNQKGQMSWKSPDGAWVEQASSRRVIRVCCLEEWLPGKKCTTGATAHRDPPEPSCRRTSPRQLPTATTWPAAALSFFPPHRPC